MPLALPENFKNLEPKSITVIPEAGFKNVDRAPAFHIMRVIINCRSFWSCHNVVLIKGLP